MELTPQTIRDRAYAARVSINQVMKQANVAASTFYRWEGDPPTAPTPLTLAKIGDALRHFEDKQAQKEAS